MAKKGEKRELVTLKCTICGERNYREEKNKQSTPGRLDLNKYCNRCKKHTLHKESKESK